MRLVLAAILTLVAVEVKAQDSVFVEVDSVVVPEVKIVVPNQELKCLTDNIYHEAPAESDLGRLAVATVTLNRASSKHFPDSICGVVYQKNPKGCQFSWTCEKVKIKRDPVLYKRAEDVALRALYKNERANVVANALYFHHVRLGRPKWTMSLKRLPQIGAHVFYSLK